MLVGNIAVLLNLLSVAVLAFSTVIFLVSIPASRAFSFLRLTSFSVRKRALWLMATSPWWVALCCVWLFWPNSDPAATASWFTEFAHWHHPDIFNVVSWHGLTLFGAGSLFVALLIRVIVQTHQQSTALRNLLSISDISELPAIDGHRVYSLKSDTVAAFTTGFIAPKIFLTSALQQQVNAQELDIVVQHELSHVHKQDPLFKFVFSLFCRFFPSRIAKQLIREFTLLTEQMADDYVTRSYDKLDIAQALVSVARVQSRVLNEREQPQLSYFSHDHVALRIHMLVSPAAKTPVLIVPAFVAFFLCTPVLTASSVDSIHHIIEAFFIH
ncbi:M56 family metallopeptidase [Paraneptunicella aestuarii]|uniref:M56 family metallopeptidase n=1 Tax=Paraneptunicella aestuarii TaxID=2831148 RepID=UPI001E561517|nr:M56 family metallopeptidase [Paraneptunicella aestuarii]UAA39066.1 M56 family metallopeptidase [Paraneptunicella aestuarii]